MKDLYFQEQDSLLLSIKCICSLQKRSFPSICHGYASQPGLGAAGVGLLIPPRQKACPWGLRMCSLSKIKGEGAFLLANRVIHTPVYQLLIPLHVVKVHWLNLHGKIVLENQILTVALVLPAKWTLHSFNHNLKPKADISYNRRFFLS